jgi:hypothetical protein
MVIVEGIVQNHHIIEASISFLWVLAEVLLGLNILFVRCHVLVYVKRIHFADFRFVSKHFRRLIHFVWFCFA